MFEVGKFGLKSSTYFCGVFLMFAMAELFRSMYMCGSRGANLFPDSLEQDVLSYVIGSVRPFHQQV